MARLLNYRTNHSSTNYRLDAGLAERHRVQIDLPARCANQCFGGTCRNRLFMCGSTAMYSLYVNAQGVAGG